MNEYAQKDALSPERLGETRDFRVRIRSVTVSLDTVEAKDGDRKGGDAPSPGMARVQKRVEATTQRMENCALASITEKDGRLEVSYDDSIDDDGTVVLSTLSFETAQPGLITLERRGPVRTLMFFEQGCRHRATYKLPFGGFEMTVLTRRLENKLTPQGGTLLLEYLLEFRGAAEEKVTLELEATRIAAQ